MPFRDENDELAGYETYEETFMARVRLRPFHGDSVQQFQYIECELQQVICQVLALAEPAAFDEPNDQEVKTENQDVYIEVEVGEKLHVNITAEEFHAMVSQINEYRIKHIFDEVTKRIRYEVTNQHNTNAPLSVTGTGSGIFFF
ncbi:unnamed protein product [Parnassius apollo]|uniref:(apollo) hypothetical protein n=1 Tax=Parnassius apollo TaxID=110799 RepID=A0A8S3XX13_PARAO|nr:unnamed protein product [Parnassius apollo]